jgi:ATP/maltotriose-dependent transcriptional regulator MalT
MNDLLEREKQLQVLTTATADAARGHGVVVLVHGEPGVGKSSLVRAYLSQLPADTRMFVGACDDLITPRALGPLRDAVRWHGGPLADAIASGADRDRVFNAVVEELSHPRDVAVLVIEDVHWADDATLDVLQYVVRRIDSLRAVVVLTYRDSDVREDHPLPSLLGAIPARSSRRMRVPRLSLKAVEALAEGTGHDARSVYAGTRGNAFFVTELLAAGEGMPATVVDAVLARLRQLDETTQAALEQLSVIPTGTTHRLVESLVGGLEVLTEAERRGVLRVDRERVSFRHELARRAIEQSLPLTRRVALNANVMRALLDTPDPDLARVMHHAVEAGDAATIAAFGPAAAREAAQVGSHHQALVLFEQVLKHDDLLDLAEHAHVREEYAWELYNAHRFAEAASAAECACELWRATGQTGRVGTALVTLSRHRWMSGDVKGAWDALDDAIAILDPDDVAGRAHAHTYRGAVLVLQERADEALQELDIAQRLAEEAGSATLVALCLNYRGTCAMERGDAEQAIALHNASVELAREAHATDPRAEFRGYAGEHIARAYTNLAAAYQTFERFDELAEVVDEALPYTIDHGFSAHAYNLQLRRCAVLVHRGEWDEAEKILRELDRTVPEPGALGRFMLPLYGRLLTRRGRPDAEEVVLRALSYTTNSGAAWLIADATTAYVEWAWLAGCAEEAAARLVDAVAMLDPERKARALAELLRYAQRAGLSTAGAFEGCPDPWATALRGDWSAAAAQFEAAGNDYERALELADSGDVGITTTALEILDRLGAVAAATLVRRRLRELGAVRIPRGPAAATKANPAGLTDRQVDVLRLMQEGLTNAEIAEKLVVSVRTVDHHVAAVLDKLDVPSRRMAAERAVELGIG